MKRKVLAYRQQAEAESIYTALAAAGSAHRERAELLRRGVALHAVDELYPYDFTDLIPGVKAALKLAHYTDENTTSQHWDSLTDEVRNHCARFSNAAQERMRASIQATVEGYAADHDLLHQRVRVALPEASNQWQGAYAIVYALVSMCWLISQSLRPEVQNRLSYARSYKIFLRVIDAALPGYRAHVASLDAEQPVR